MKSIRRVLRLVFFLFLVLALSCESPEKHYQSFSSVEELQYYLNWAPGKTPLVSAHRGGPMAGVGQSGFPENCLATFENALNYAPCLIECDVRKSKDGQLFLLHDETLERTTSGSGAISERTSVELGQLFLKDEAGKHTAYRIPTLSETLEWARGKAIVTLDVKRGVTAQEIAEIILRHKAESYSTVITYNLESALRYHQLNPELMISASAEGPEAARRLVESGIPPRNLLGFVGVYEPPREIYQLLHQHGIRAILGTIGNLDRKAEKEGLDVYVDLLKNGADILATDNVPLAAKAIEKFSAQYIRH
jgi:glycerophosphoryl diester phosphodiesterase